MRFWQAFHLSFVSFEFYYFITSVESSNSNKSCFIYLHILVHTCTSDLYAYMYKDQIISFSHWYTNRRYMRFGLYTACIKFTGIFGNAYVTLNNQISESTRWKCGTAQRFFKTHQCEDLKAGLRLLFGLKNWCFSFSPSRSNATCWVFPIRLQWKIIWPTTTMCCQCRMGLNLYGKGSHETAAILPCFCRMLYLAGCAQILAVLTGAAMQTVPQITSVAKHHVKKAAAHRSGIASGVTEL